MSARLTSGIFVSALLRRVSREGGNAVVVAKGDSTAGAVLLICLDKGRLNSFRERLLSGTGSYVWAPVGPDADAESGAIAAWLERRRARDPDLWIVELDIPNAERFAAETSGDG